MGSVDRTTNTERVIRMADAFEDLLHRFNVGTADKSDLDKLNEKIADLKSQIFQSKNIVDRKPLEDKLKEAQDALGLYANVAPKLPPNKKKAVSPGLSVEEEREARNKFRKASGLSLIPKPKSSEEQARSNLLKTQQKIAKKTLQNISRSGRTAARFSLPSFAVDNATGIVIASLIIIAALEIGAGTKFVSLWNYAFSPQSTLPTTGKGEGGKGTLGLHTEWGIPDMWNYLEGAAF